ncbi:Crp/Fnr family transcriptional regulator [uncultured Cohaesibacter sp.]|uniref:Crp/Fnr family transcriptional regulator n=1 Tax=uncultured Cohaesibacter sp. TaxID=1002546 RepID=UPI0029C88135|nr:Crp/Fnr family transcriptional regulator [uncultured Cohaesibacter sp.]
MKTILNTPIALKLSACIGLSEHELEILGQLLKESREIRVGQDLVQQGETNQAAFILMSGWVCSYKIQADGTRQIVDFQIPGDFLGVRSVLFHTSDHNIEPITEVEVCEILIPRLLDTFAQHPRLAMALLWALSRDEAMVVEHLVNIGRRNPAERMAHFLLELGARLSLIGAGSKTGFTCPLTQPLLADALGLSAVHVNRVLRQLREVGMATFRDGQVVFDNYDRLVAFADFDSSYLDQAGPLLT